MALGIGANSAIFSLINAVLLKPLPFPEAHRIVELQENSLSPVVSPRRFAFWRQRITLVQDVSAHWLDHINLNDKNRPELIAAGLVSADFFHLYGAPILYGRTFTEEEDRPGGRRVVILSVGPFNTELFDQAPDLWVPFQIAPTGQNKDGRLCYVTARLKRGGTLDAARAELQALAHDYERLHPSGVRQTAAPTVQPLIEALSGDFRGMLLILAGAVGLVLLIAWQTSRASC